MQPDRPFPKLLLLPIGMIFISIAIIMISITLRGDPARITLSPAGCAFVDNSQVPLVASFEGGCLIHGLAEETRQGYQISLGNLEVFVDKTHIIGFVRDDAIKIERPVWTQWIRGGGIALLVVATGLLIGFVMPNSSDRDTRELAAIPDMVATLKREIRHTRIMLLAGFVFILLIIAGRL